MVHLKNLSLKINYYHLMMQSGKSAENSKRKLFVGGLPSNIDEAQLREGFSSYGKVGDGDDDNVLLMKLPQEISNSEL